MAQAKCGRIFSWDTLMWCKGTENKCKGCPLNIKFKYPLTDEGYDY